MQVFTVPIPLLSYRPKISLVSWIFLRLWHTKVFVAFWSFASQFVGLLQSVWKYFVVCGDPSAPNISFTLLSVTVGASTYDPFQYYDSGTLFSFAAVLISRGGLCSPAEAALVNTAANLFSDFLWCCTVLLPDYFQGLCWISSLSWCIYLENNLTHGIVA